MKEKVKKINILNPSDGTVIAQLEVNIYADYHETNREAVGLMEAYCQGVGIDPNKVCWNFADAVP